MLPILSAYLFTLMAAQIFYFILLLGTGFSADSLNRWAMPVTAAVEILFFPIGFWMYKRDRDIQKGWSRKIKNKKSEFFLLFLMGMGVSQLANIFVSLLGLARYSKEYEEILETSIVSQGLFLQIFTVCIIAPVFEELIFRGLLFRRLRDYCSFPWAAVLSAVIFGAYHGNLLQAVYASIIGFVLAFAVEYTGTLWAGILMHMSGNLFSILLQNFGMELLEIGNGLFYLELLLGLTIVAIAGFVYFWKREKRRKI